MTGRYKEYPEERNSNISWICEIPVHWNLKKFKNLFRVRKRIAGKLGFNILSITQQGIKVKDTKSGDGQLSMDYSKYQIVNIYDFGLRSAETFSEKKIVYAVRRQLSWSTLKTLFTLMIR